LYVVTLFFLGACASPARVTTLTPPAVTAPGPMTPGMTASPLPDRTPTPVASPTPTNLAATRADVVLTEAQQQIETTVKVGQIINVQDLPGQEWNVSYRSEVLSPLTPPDKMQQPGADGWFFRVNAAGHTEIVLTSQTPPCPAGTTCPPNIMRIVFPVQAQP